MASLPPEFPDIYEAGLVYDVLVVGAGIQGSATAYHCVKNGLKTLLLEQFSLPHTRGSSHGQSRIIRFTDIQPHVQGGSCDQSQTIRYSDVQSHYCRMMVEAYPMWTTLEKETNTQLYRKTGLLNISINPDGKLFNDALHQMKQFGRSYKLLDAEDMRRNYPEINLDPGAKVFLDFDAGTLKADKALRCFQTEFVKRGGILRDEERMLEIVPGTVVTVKTNIRQYRARSVVLTPGPWTSKVLNPLGLQPPLKTLRISVPYWKEKSEGSMKNFPNFIIELPSSEHIYGLQTDEYPGLVKIPYHGSSDVVDPDQRDDVPRGEKREDQLLKKCISKYFPSLKDEPSIKETCMYTNTPDEELIIDRHPIYPNIVIGCGCSGHGFKLAPALGKIMCHLAMGKEPHIDIRALSFNRFKNSCLMSGSKL